MKNFLLSIFLFLSFSIKAQPTSPYYQSDTDLLENGVQDMMIVTASGLGGALLGLSTLSFEKRPSEHYNHILVGGAVGIIIGVGIVLYRQTTKGHTLPERPTPAYSFIHGNLPEINLHKERREGFDLFIPAFVVNL